MYDLSVTTGRKHLGMNSCAQSYELRYNGSFFLIQPQVRRAGRITSDDIMGMGVTQNVS